MKTILSFAATFAVTTLVYAGTINLSAGESITLSPGQTTTVQCLGGGDISYPSQPVVEYSFCECKSATINGRNLTQALQTTKYTNKNPYTSTLKEFHNGFGDDGENKCNAFIKSVAACRH